MEGRQINLRISEELLKKADSILKRGSYDNLQEFFKEKLREEIRKQEEIQEAVKRLQMLKGSASPKQRLTKEQLNKIAVEHTPEKAARITKELNLQKITFNKKS